MNKAMLIGHVGQEPEVRYFEADQAYARIRLATTERGYTLPNGTQVPDRTDWHNLLFSKGLAKIVERYVHKGDKLYVEGRIRYRSYDDKKGQKRYYTEIDVENMELLSPKPTTNVQEGLVSDSTGTSQNTSGTNDQEQLPF
jgi:single-strand DNA-binding protein